MLRMVPPIPVRWGLEPGPGRRKPAHRLTIIAPRTTSPGPLISLDVLFAVAILDIAGVVAKSVIGAAVPAATKRVAVFGIHPMTAAERPALVLAFLIVATFVAVYGI
jgi:hypothetical protein